MMQIRQIQTAHVTQLDAFKMLPSTFIRVEIRRITRERLQMNVFGSALREIGFDFSSPMNGRAVPNHQQVAVQLGAQVF